MADIDKPCWSYCFGEDEDDPLPENRRYYWFDGEYGHPRSIIKTAVGYVIFDDPGGETIFNPDDIECGPFKTLTEAKVHYLVLEATRG